MATLVKTTQDGRKLEVVGLAIAPLFIAMILMAGLGGTALGCEQG